MKKYLRKILILVFPFLLMILVNEYKRLGMQRKYFSIYGVPTLNPTEKQKDKCSWACHNHTNYCKENHIKYLNNQLKYTDYLYFGVIDFLQSFGSYKGANVFFLGILLPLMFWWLLIKSIDMTQEIHKIHKRNARN